MNRASSKLRLLSTLHLLAMLAIALWWALYFWRHSPARVFLGAARPLGQSAEMPFGSVPTDALARFSRASAADLAAGFVTFLLFAIGTGVHVRRLEIWLGARGSGQAVSFGGTGLEAQALSANTDKGKVL